MLLQLFKEGYFSLVLKSLRSRGFELNVSFSQWCTAGCLASTELSNREKVFMILQTYLCFWRGNLRWEIDLKKLLQTVTVFIADQGSGFCVTGKIEAGYIQVGERLLAMPPNETCTAKGTVFRSVFTFRSILGLEAVTEMVTDCQTDTNCQT